MSRRRAPRSVWAVLSEGTRAQRVGGAGIVANASPVRAAEIAISAAQGSVSGGTTGAKASKIEQFTLGTDGAQSLPLSFLPLLDSEGSVSLNGVVGKKGTDWTVSGQSLNLLTPMGALSGDDVEIQYDYLLGLPSTPGTRPTVLWKWAFDIAPTTSGTAAWSVANGTYFGNNQRNGSGVIPSNGWASDCHGHKTVAAQVHLAAGCAFRSSVNTFPVDWISEDTDPDDYGLLSLAIDEASTCSFYIGISNTGGRQYLQLYGGRRVSPIAISAVPLSQDVGHWHYIELEASLADGYARVYMDNTILIDHSFTGTPGATLSTLKMGGFYPTDLITDDLYLATNVIGDPGDVTTLVVP